MDKTAPYVVTETACLMLRRHGSVALHDLCQTAVTFDRGGNWRAAMAIVAIHAEAEQRIFEEPKGLSLADI